MTDHQNMPSVDDINTRAIRTYDPRPKMTQIKGQWYLEVRYRLAWFRAEFPFGKIDTTIHHVSGESAVIHCTVTAMDENGTHLGTGSGIGSCTKSEFPAYIEKSETKAIGRALASLGFGTQFSLEYDEDPSQLGNLADAPTGHAPSHAPHAPTPMRQAPQGSPQTPNQWQGGNQQGQGQYAPQRPAQAPQGGYQNNGGGGTGPGGYPLASPAQRNMMEARSREKQIDLAQFIAATVPGQTLDTLGKRDASTVIDALLNAPNGGGPVGGAYGAEEQAQQVYQAGQNGGDLNEAPF